MRILIAATLGMAISVAAPAATPLSFASLKAFVESKNERVHGKKLEHEAAKYRRGSYARSYFPTAELYAAQESFKKGPLPRKSQPAYGAELRVNVFNGGRDLLEDERRTMVAERKRMEGVSTLAFELGRAREIYWTVLYLRDFTALLEGARRTSQESLKAAERRIKSGVATEADRVEFEIQDMDLKRELERATLELANQKRNLAVVLGLEADAGLEFPEVLAHEHDWEKALDHTEQDHEFLVKPLLLQAQEADVQARAQRRAWLPKLDAFAAYNQYNQREEDGFALARDRTESVVGLRLSMNPFDNFFSSRESAALVAEADAAMAQAAYGTREVENHLHGEIAELKLLHAQVHSAEENIQRAERYYRLTQSEYTRGVKNSPDVLGASEKLTLMRQRRLEIVRDFQIAKSHVLSKIGK